MDGAPRMKRRRMKLSRLYPYWWPAGFEIGAVARVRSHEWTEGMIVQLTPPETDLDVPGVYIRSWKGERVFASLETVECKGIDYAVETPRPTLRRRRRKAGAATERSTP